MCAPISNFWSIFKFCTEFKVLSTAVVHVTITGLIWTERKCDNAENKQLALMGGLNQWQWWQKLMVPRSTRADYVPQFITVQLNAFHTSLFTCTGQFKFCVCCSVVACWLLTSWHLRAPIHHVSFSRCSKQWQTQGYNCTASMFAPSVGTAPSCGLSLRFFIHYSSFR